MCIDIQIKKMETASSKTGQMFQKFPCGKCPICVKSKIKDWMFRIEKEMEISTRPLFLTLTYDENNVPLSNNGLKTLRKRDIQLFMKRLRKEYEKFSTKKIRYYAVGEYGTKTKRPHYHCIMFNMERPELINKAWGHGFTYSPNVNQGGIGYVLKYISKPRDKWMDDRQREFSLMSKGIGQNYITEATRAYHNHSVRNSFITLRGGVKIRMPKYIKEKIYDKEMRLKVTEYLNERIKSTNFKKINKIIQKNRKLNKNKAETLLEIRKNHSRFEERKEVL